MNIAKQCSKKEQNNYYNASGSNQYRSPVQSNAGDIKLYHMSFSTFIFVIRALILSASVSLLFSFFIQSHCRAVWIHEKSIASIWGLAGSLPGAPGRAVSEKAVKPTLWSSCSMCRSLRWILSKIEAHHVVTVLFFSLSPPLFTHSLVSCYLALNRTADELGIEFMGKTTFFFFHWLLSIFRVPYVCEIPHTNTHTIQHNKATHLGKLMRASRHGNTVVVN